MQQVFFLLLFCVHLNFYYMFVPKYIKIVFFYFWISNLFVKQISVKPKYIYKKHDRLYISLSQC